MSRVESWQAAFRDLAPQLPGAGLPWLAATRRRALERFADLGWPSSRLENWRHTSLNFLDDARFAAMPGRDGGTNTGTLQALAERLRGDDPGHWLVFVDGRFVPSLSEVGALPNGVRVASLAQALADAPELVEAVFGDAEQGEVPAALNAAMAADGAFIRLERGAVVEEPIHLLFIATTPGLASHPRNLIVAEAGAQAKVVEHFVSSEHGGDRAGGSAGVDGSGKDESSSPTLTNAVTRVQVHADAQIRHLKLQQEANSAVHLASIDALQGRGSMFASHSMSFGARLARNDIGTRFEGEGCEALLNGLYHVDGRRHVDHHTRIDHAQPRGVSREFYRGIVDETGRGVFSGRIIVAPGAVKTDAVQRTDSLLLSARAESDARPELEIYADDVKCAHGATVGQLDEEALFYLRSRGVDEAHARNILTYAFAAEVLARIGLAPLRARAQAAIRSRLPGGELMESLS
jgi:Fe-S cluster assembly protein SufD